MTSAIILSHCCCPSI